MSFGSRLFREESAAAIRRVIAEVERYCPERCLGYQLGYGAYNEWIPWGIHAGKAVDFNPRFVAGFRAWLRSRYGTEEALRQSWNDKDATFDSALPSREAGHKEQAPRTGRLMDPATRKRLLDSREYLAHAITDTARFYASVVKEATGGRALVGLYGGTNYQYTILTDLLASSDIDFFCSSTGYGDRGIRGVTYDQALALETVKAHGKLYIHDADIRTYLFPAQQQAHFGSMTAFGRAANVRDSIMILRREWGAMAARGAGLTYLNILKSPAFLNPAMHRDIAVMDATGRGLLELPRSSAAEIAVVVRHAATHFAHYYYGETYRTALYRIGAPVDIFQSTDLSSLEPEKYRLIVFLMTAYLEPATRRRIEALKGGGRTLLWSFGAGYVTENALSTDAMRELTGFTFSRRAGMLPWMVVDRRRQVVARKGAEPRMQHGPVRRGFPRPLRQAVPGMLMGPRGSGYFVVEPAADTEALGRHAETGEIVFARRRGTGHVSVYYPGYAIPHQSIRAVAREAGCHIYTEGNEGFYANRHLLVVSTGAEGAARTVRLPQACTVYDVFRQRLVGSDLDAFAVAASPDTTSAFVYGTAAEVERVRAHSRPKFGQAADWRWSD